MDENITKTEETTEAIPLERVAEIIIDENTVSIPLSHLEELVAAKTKLGILTRMARRVKSYNWDDYFAVICGEDDVEGGADA